MKIPSHRIVAGALVFTAAIAWAGLFWPVAAAGEANPAKRTVRNRPLPLAGKLLVTGTATINGKKALSGSTIFSENRITVAKTTGNVATITLGGLGRLDLQPGTELVLRFADGIIGGELLAGEAVIHNNAGVKVALQTPAGFVTADGKTATATVANTQQQQQTQEPQPKLEPVNQGGSGGGFGGGGGGGGGSGGGLGLGGRVGLAGLAGIIGAIGVSAITDDNDSPPSCVTVP